MPFVKRCYFFVLVLMCWCLCLGVATKNGTKSSDSEKWTKPLFHDKTADAIGSVLAFLTVIIGQAGGIGGGGLLVPMYIIILQLGKFAIPLSKATIFGSAIAGVMKNSFKRHPTANRPITDFKVALILEPMTLAGTIIGVLLNALFPQWLITILLVLLLSYTSNKTWKKARSLWKKESSAKHKEIEHHQQQQQQQYANNQVDGRIEMVTSTNTNTNISRDKHTTTIANHEAVAVPTHTHASHPNNDSNDNDRSDSNVTDSDVHTHTRALPTTTTAATATVEIEDDSRKHQQQQDKVAEVIKCERKVPWFSVEMLTITWCVICVCALLKGGHGAPSIAKDAVKCGGWSYWLVIVLAFLITIAITCFCAVKLFKEYQYKLLIGYQFIKGDVEWNLRNSLLYPGICVVAGIAAGLLGIGAGMVQSPLMLEMGMLPEVTAATSMFMVLFTSSSTTMQFLALGMLRYDYALWYGGIGFIGALAGQIVTDFVVHKFGRPSVVVYAVCLVTALSAVAMGVQGIVNASNSMKDHHNADLRFHPLC